MERQVEVLNEGRILRLAKRIALKEGRPLDDLIRDAIVAYLSDSVSSPQKREKAYQLFCERPIQITRKQFQKVINGDPWVV
jgi:hypothetical protein